jgi:glycosyltransferase involved in cell wall biosynthesis
MRILIINQLFPPLISGGAEVICARQAEQLLLRGHKVFVLSADDPNTGLKKEEKDNLIIYRCGIKNFYLGLHRPQGKIKHLFWHLRDSYNYGMRGYVKQVIELTHPDVAICHALVGFSISVWDEIKAHHIPLIQILHDQYLRCPKTNTFRNNKVCMKPCIECKLLRLFHKRASSKVDAVVGVSNYVMQTHIANGYFKNSKKYVIHNAINIPEVRTINEWDGKRRLKIGYIGQLSHHKGVDVLLNTFLKIQINATLVLAGKCNPPEFLFELRKISGNSKDVEFLGFVNSLDFYKNVDLIVIPSLWPDTFPTVAFEACANNVPVICSNSGGLPEIIHNGVNGIIYDVNDVDGLGKSLLKLYKNHDLLNIMKHNARKSVEEMIDEDANIIKYENVINSLLS